MFTDVGLKLSIGDFIVTMQGQAQRLETKAFQGEGHEEVRELINKDMAAQGQARRAVGQVI